MASGHSLVSVHVILVVKYFEYVHSYVIVIVFVFVGWNSAKFKLEETENDQRQRYLVAILRSLGTRRKDSDGHRSSGKVPGTVTYFTLGHMPIPSNQGEEDWEYHDWLRLIMIQSLAGHPSIESARRKGNP